MNVRKNNIFTLLSVFMLIINYSIKAQMRFTCGSDDLHNRLIEVDADYQKQFDNINLELYHILREKYNSKREGIYQLTNYVIPVVVHIITPPGTPVGTGNNLTDTQVEAGLQLLNESFANYGQFNAANGVDVGISFCLAKRDPSGMPTNGITRTESTLVADPAPCSPFGTDMGNGSLIKNLINWNCKDYVNIWLVTDLYNSNFGCSLAGFATFPGAGCGFDGVVQESRYWITKSGTTVSAHELGHYFSLNHTFNGGCTNADCLLDGDRVCDTPPDGSPSFAPCNINSCNTDIPDLADDNTNYMDYTSCTPPHFTQGQKDRMLLGLEKGRTSLITSQGCIPVVKDDIAIEKIKVPGEGCGTEICTEVIIKNTGSNNIIGSNIILKIDGIIQLNFPWSGNLAPNTKDTILLPCVNTTLGFHTISVEVQNPNGKTDGYPLNNILNYGSINIHPKPVLSLADVDSTRCGNNGKISVQSSGGTLPYLYFIDSDPFKPKLSPVFYNLKNQNYTIIVADSNACRDTIMQYIPDFCPPCISGVINQYASVYDFCDSATVYVDNPAGFKPGGKVLIYQANGAVADTSNTVSFGNVLDYGNSGNYEINQIAFIEGNKITLKYYLLNQYDTPVGTQIVDIPYLGNATVCNLTCAPWNGQKGGILIFEADTLSLAGNIDVTGKGFEGGILQYAQNSTPPFTDYFSGDYNDGGAKGDAIAAPGPNYRYGKGNIANGGGGGNDLYAGGGGGSNSGKGGKGGMGFTPPNNPVLQGLGGIGLAYNSSTGKIFFGGGGGAGHSYIQGCSNFSNKAAGGGIVILDIKACIGNNNKIIASGANASAPGVKGCNGSGGGGGGAVIFNSLSGSADLMIETNGGDGSDTYSLSLQGFIGPGGGGGGGILLTNLSSGNLLATHTQLGGLNGKLDTDKSYGAESGSPGNFIPDYKIKVSSKIYDPIGQISFKIDTFCFGSGFVQVQTINGTGKPEYNLDNNGWQPYGAFEGIGSGFHSISIRSQCASLDTFLIINWPTAIGDSLLFLKSVDCQGKGRIGITGIHGTPPYQYKLNAGAYQNSGVFENLDPGNYTVTIKDALGCQISKSLSIPDKIVNLTLKTDSLKLIKNCIDSTAFIAVHAEGSNPYYYYSLNGGPSQPIGIFLNLPAGNNSITAFDEFGCASAPLDFTVILQGSGISTSSTYEICQGEKVTVGTNDYYTTGIYTDTLKTLEGCDSIVVSEISVFPVFQITNNYQICQGDSVKVGSNTYFQSGSFQDKFISSQGCDSTVISNITILPFKTNNQSLKICKGTSVKVGQNVYTQSGIYTDTLKTISGCDSVVTTLLTVLDSSITDLNYFLCSGESVVINNKTYSKTGQYTDKLTNQFGCDSILKIDLQVNDTVLRYQDRYICEGDTIMIGGQIFTKPGNFKEVLMSSVGCDSVVVTRIYKSKPSACDSQYCKIYVPNAFSPDLDGVNDYFEVFSDLVNINQMDIFDRWGELVVSIRSNTPKWNGKSATGKSMHQGVYLYLLYGNCSNGKPFLKAGEVTLVR